MRAGDLDPQGHAGMLPRVPAARGALKRSFRQKGDESPSQELVQRREGADVTVIPRALGTLLIL
jgi:hypothetical protein